MAPTELTHFDESGRPQMVDLSTKESTRREAYASGEISMAPATLARIKAGRVEKGDVLSVAQVAAIMAVKDTSRLIPLAHPLNISAVNIDFNLNESESKIEIGVRVKLRGQTGVEMEALTGVSAAALTIYDMCKAVDKNMRIGNIRLLEKRGGRSGLYRRQEQPRYRFATVTVSDKGAAGERTDKSGPLLGELLLPWGKVEFSLIVPDERETLVAELRRLVDCKVDAVFISGGTGLAPRDITPEATLEIIDRSVPGMAEAMRRETSAATPRAMLSRAQAGISGQTLIVNLPGSPKAVRECFAVLEPVLGHALETLTGRGGECGAG